MARHAVLPSCIVLGVALLGVVPPAAACRKAFSGAEFLGAAAIAGKRPRQASACATVNVRQNRFYALSKGACLLNFYDDDWLEDGMHFVRIQAGGPDATAYPTQGGVQVRIEPERGFRMIRVVIETGNADPKSCDLLRVGDVVR
jgi:hypothetical protein